MLKRPLCQSWELGTKLHLSQMLKFNSAELCSSTEKEKCKVLAREEEACSSER